MNFRRLTLIATAALILGCGGGDSKVATVPVKGKLYVDDKIFGPALMQLTPEPPDPKIGVVNGYVKKDGSFQLQTYKEGDGAPVGKYRVVLSMDPLNMGSVPPVKPLTVEVTKSSGTLDIKLESTGGEMVSPLPPPGQEGGRTKSGGGVFPGSN
jgi:hypothetical protein